MALKNYFYDVLPLDLQDLILNINKKETLKICFNALYNNRWDNKNKGYKKYKFDCLDDTTRKIIIIEKMTRFKKFKEGLNLIREETKEKIKKIFDRKKELKKYIKERDEILYNEGEAALYKNRNYEDVVEEHEGRKYEIRKDNIDYKIWLVKRNRDHEQHNLIDDYIKNYYLIFDYDDEIYNRNYKKEMIKKYRY